MLKNIKGFQPVSLIDYPGQISAILFLSGCNMRCQFCHNPELVLTPNQGENFDEDKIFNYLESRRGKIDGLVITGGEPTLQEGLKEFIQKVKARGFLVKLDTNGLLPEKLEGLIPLVDFVAMDIKSSKEKYSLVAGCKVDLAKIQESIDLIMKSDVDYEFRTTVLPDFFTKEDVISIGKWLKDSKKYALQQFAKKETTLDPKFMKTKPYDIKELNEFKKILKPYFDEVEVRD